MQISTYRRAARAMTILLSMSGAIASMPLAFAQSAPPSAEQRGPGGRGDRTHMMRGVERLKASLRLDANQAQLWERAAAQMKPPAEMRGQMRTQRDRLAAMLDDPGFDPRTLAAEMDRDAGERKARMTAIRDAWFAVYDSLNAAQRGQVREFLRARLARGEGRQRSMEDRSAPPR